MINDQRLLHYYRRLHRHFGPQHWWPGETPFEVMAGAILTQNTNWANAEAAIQNLKRAGLLAPGAIDRHRPQILARLLRPSGFFNQKARRLKGFVRFFIAEYRDETAVMRRQRASRLRMKLLGLHGIGPETADAMLLYALGKRVFVIDAYTRRIFSRHGFLTENAPYAQWQRLFMDGLPRSAALYNEYHALIVRTGKDYCRKAPKCAACPLSDFRLKFSG